MKQKKVPMRTCCITNEQYPKKDLIRIVRTPEANVIVDKTGRANGRGAYLLLNKDVILKAKKTKVLDRKLEVSVPDSIYDELLGMLDA